MPKYATHCDRRRERYRIGRLQLIYKLGGQCVQCAEDDPALLEFDHKGPRDWVASKTSRWVRLAKYKREADAGRLQLLCKTCNKRKGKPSVSDEPLPE